MSKELTKLTEEMYDSLTKFVKFMFRYRLEGDRHAEHEMKMATAANLVSYIGEAYANGLELPGEVARFGVSKHGVTVKHFWEEDVKLWRMELEAINYTGMMRFEYTYYAHNKEDLPWPEGRTHNFDLIALCKEKLEDLDKWIGEDIEEEIRRQFPNR